VELPKTYGMQEAIMGVQEVIAYKMLYHNRIGLWNVRVLITTQLYRQDKFFLHLRMVVLHLH